MKTKFTLAMLMLCFISTWSLGQTKISKLAQAKEIPFLKKHVKEKNVFNKQATIKDTIHYAYAKETILGTSNYYILPLWQVDNEALSQVFTAPTQGLKIHSGVFYARKNTSSATNCTVTVSLYKADATNSPTGNALATKTVNVTTEGFYYANFTQPVNISGNYAIVIKPTSTNAIVDLYINDIAVGQPYDENFATFTSTYSPYGSNGKWIQTTSILDLGQQAQFEGLIGSVVSYDIKAQATLSANTVCVDKTISFTNTTDTGIISDRMYNYNKFTHHFGKAQTDSTFAWQMGDNTNPIWSKNATHSYNTSGTYAPKLNVFTGFWRTYSDVADFSVNINAKDDSSFSYPATTICKSSNNITPNSITTSGGQFSSTTGLVFVNNATGEINITASTPGTYVITYTTAGSCPTSSTQSIEILGAINTAVNTNSTTLTAVQEGQNISYQWIDCTNDTPIPGATSQSYTPTQSGSYAVTISNGNCQVTSACYSVTTLGISNSEKISFNIYPNPAERIITIDGLTDKSTISIIDNNGRVISSQVVDTKKTEINVQHLVKGTYLIQVDSKNKKNVRKFIKK